MMCMIDGAETYEVYHDRWVMSIRKPRECCGCRREIQRGEQARTTSGLYDGMWERVTYCHHCTFATRWLYENCGGYLDHAVLEDIGYHLGEEIYWGDERFIPMARVVIGMRRHWERFDKAGLMPLPHEIPVI